MGNRGDGLLAEDDDEDEHDGDAHNLAMVFICVHRSARDGTAEATVGTELGPSETAAMGGASRGFTTLHRIASREAAYAIAFGRVIMLTRRIKVKIESSPGIHPKLNTKEEFRTLLRDDELSSCVHGYVT
ncbi:hypothetical protein RB195_008413 [Necator americanus]|uniref:Uncharacterized protein n=1 Tax=Necator americanus TaxID=51031 RepID=A0ABR1CQE3_NECAM